MVPPPFPAPGPPPARSPRAPALLDALRHELRARVAGVAGAELADRLRIGTAPPETPGPPRLATGLPAVDALLGGGFPRGRLCEITGPLSSGRTSLALALVAAATRAGETAAVVDAADALDPGAAASAGVDLARVLWARPARAGEALRCAERLLEARGFGVVVVDIDRGGDAGRTEGAPIWLRMSRSAAASGTALVLLSPRSRVGPFAALTLEAQLARACFAARPGWLEGLETQLAAVRSRLGPIDRSGARLCWRVHAARGSS